VDPVPDPLHFFFGSARNRSPTSGGRSVGIVRSRTQTMEFSFFSFSAGNRTRASGSVAKNSDH
jgi:hypothetical protein